MYYSVNYFCYLSLNISQTTILTILIILFVTVNNLPDSVDNVLLTVRQ